MCAPSLFPLILTHPYTLFVTTKFAYFQWGDGRLLPPSLVIKGGGGARWRSGVKI